MDPTSNSTAKQLTFKFILRNAVVRSHKALQSQIFTNEILRIV